MSWLGTYEENKFYEPQLLHSMYKSLPTNRRWNQSLEQSSIVQTDSYDEDTVEDQIIRRK